VKTFLRGTGMRRYTRKHLVHDRDTARARILHLEAALRDRDTDVDDRDQTIAQLRADAVDVGVERQLRKAAEEWAGELLAKVTKFEAAEANAHAVTVPPMHRDIDPDETATDPVGIDVRELREQLATT
jgi:hypothetical protein